MLTRRGRVVVVFSALFLLAGRILGVTELFGLATASVAVVLVGVFRVRSPQLRVLLAARVVPAVISVGDLATLELSVENSGAVPTPPSRLELVPAGGAEGPLIEVPRLVPGEKASVSLRLPTGRRGRHEVTGFEAVVTDALGTAQRRVGTIGTVRYGVRPLVEPLSGTLPSGDGGADLETTRSSADRLRSGASLLRPYLPGDDLRRIHWATTARVGELMVREGGDRELDASSGVVIVLSLFAAGGPDHPHVHEHFEDAVRVVASLLTAAAREGSFRLVVPGGTDTGEGSGSRHLDTALEALTGVQVSLVTRVDEIRPPLPRQSSFEARVAFFVAACTTSAELPTLFGSSPELAAPSSSAVVVIGAGGTEGRIDQVGRRQLFVTVPPGGSLEELWSAGETSLVGL
ncbi:MAG: DUF58 domain-containing protein [Acidimicrobiales bacterium]